MPTLRRKIAVRLLGDRAHWVVRGWRAARRRSPFEPSLSLRVTRRFVKSHGLRVSGGPFSGLVFHRAAIGAGPLAPKLVGAYELELHAAVEERIAAGPGLVVDVGSAEGYYAVGLARRLPDARVVAFDSDPEARRLTQLCARANGVQGRVQIRGLATVGALGDLELGPEALLIVDCEGAEDVLLDPERLPRLRATPMIVELHEHLSAGVGERLAARFRASHELTTIGAADRASFHLGGPTAAWPEHERVALLDEGRPAAMSWLVMLPREHPADAQRRDPRRK